jgi:polyferredoxin
MGAIEGVIAGSFIMFALLFVLSFFLGRSPCSFFCPVGGLQECLTLVNPKKAKNGKRSHIKYFVWVPWMAAIIIMFVRFGGVSRVDFFYFIVNGFSLYEPYSYIIYYGIVGLVVALSVILGNRAFCHCICWISPFMVIGSKISDWFKLPKLHLKAEKSNCSSCGACSSKCPMGIDVKKMVLSSDMKDPECILCGECVDACNKKAIRFSFRK